MFTYNTKKAMVLLTVVSLSLLSGSLFAADTGNDTITGTVAAVNELTVAGQKGLDLGSAGSDALIATITISNNAETAFDLELSFANGGILQHDTAAGVAVPFTAFSLAGGSGTLGSGLSAPSGAFSLTTNAYTWDTGAVQTTATTGYNVLVNASWDAGTVAGSYSETITATIVVGDGV